MENALTGILLHAFHALLEIVIRLKFSRIRNLFHLFQFFAFTRYPHINEPLRENAAFCQIIVVGLQCVQRFAQRFRQSFDFFLFFPRQRIQVKIIRPPS